MKEWVHERFAELADELAQTTWISDPAALADQLTLIMEGAYASVQALGVEGPARHARAFAEAILPIGNPPARPRAGVQRKGKVSSRGR